MKSKKIYIPLLYTTVGVAWILLSDKALIPIIGNLEASTLINLSIAKGILFIVITAVLLYVFLAKLENKIQDNLHLEDTLNSISDSFCTLNRNWVLTRANANFYECTGIKADVTGKTLQELFPGSEDSLIYLGAKRAMDNQLPERVEAFDEPLNKWLKVAYYPTKEGISVYFTDITSEKEKEIQLKVALERYDLASRATGDVIYDLDLAQNEIVFSQQISALIGRPAESIAHSLTWWRQFVHPDDLDRVVSSFTSNISNNTKKWQAEYRIQLPDNGYKYICDQYYLLLDAQNEPVRIIGCIKDIDQIKQSALQIRRLGEILDKIHNPVIISDPTGIITWVNAAFIKRSGYSESECIGRRHADLLYGPNTDWQAVYQLIAAVARHEAFSGELLLYTKEKVEYWVSLNLSPIYNDAGELESYISVENDITERKEKEAKIGQQSEQLKNVSWLNSHEIRKPVASILALIQLVKTSTDKEEREHMLETLCECAEELDEIIHRINEEASAD
jgi:PAS domain S-box-containing protein